MMTRSAHTSWGWVCGAAALVILATLTPQQGPSAGADFFVPLIPERLGQWRDVVQNVILYLPLGLLLGARRISAAKVILISAVLSFAIELSQFIVPGRDPIARDAVTNTIGGAIGWLLSRTPIGTVVEALLGGIERRLARIRHPGRELAAYLSLFWALAVTVATTVTCWLLIPDLPPPLFFGVASSTIDHTRGPVNIGGNGSGARGFNGVIDEIRIYTRARSSDEVSADMNRAVEKDAPGGDLAAAYGFDSAETALTHDASGARRRVFAREATWVPDGRFGGAISFNGSTSQLAVTDAAFDFSRGFTVEAWVFPRESRTDDALVIADAGEVFFFRATSYLSALPLSGVRFGGAPRMVGPRRRLAVRRWSHVATTYDGRFLQMYIDGQLAGETAHWSTHHPTHIDLNGDNLPFGVMRDPRSIPSILLGDFALDVAVTCGPLLKRPAPFFLLAGIQSIDALELIAAGSELRVRFPRNAQRLGLAFVDQRIGGGLEGCAEGQGRHVIVRGPLQRARLDDGSGGERQGVRPGIGSGWSFLLDSQFLPVWLVMLVTCGYLAAIAFPFGWWARGAFSSVVGAVALLVNALVVPRLWELQAPGVLELLAIVAGACLGFVTARRFVQPTISAP